MRFHLWGTVANIRILRCRESDIPKNPRNDPDHHGSVAIVGDIKD